MKRFIAILALSILASLCERTAADEESIQTFEWNAFLSDWQVLGPFPKGDGDPTGLQTKYVEDEATLSGGHVTFYGDQLFTWKQVERPYIEFRGTFKAPNEAGNNKVAYAWTQFRSPVEQKALLCVAYDDTFVAWLNEKEIGRGTDNWASSLDQSVTEVSLQAGVNTVLLKVGNGEMAWDAAVRLRPVGIDEPLLTFGVTPGGNVTRLPDILVTLLDSTKQTISTHRCSGSRKSYPGPSSYYTLYAAMPETTPQSVRFNVDVPGFADSNAVFPWNRVKTGKVKVPLKADKPAELLVVDRKTRKPIAGAEVWTRNASMETLSGDDGRITVEGIGPMLNQVWIAARGYAARSAGLKWPRGDVQRVELTAGGRSISGIVTSTDGNPLEGATIQTGSSRGFWPSAVTDEYGRFEIFGLPNDRTTIYPVVECPGFITKDRFALSLPDKTTSVAWELALGAQIAGRVTHRETGEPISGIKIVTGNDRFGSNNRNPTATTNADGMYRLLGVDPGRNQLHAFSANYAPAMSVAVTSLGTETEVNFRLTEGKPVTGTVTDPDGKPLASVWLVTDTWNGARMFQRETRSDGNGKFTLAAMPEIPAEVHVLKQGYISHRSLMVKGGDNVSLTLKPVVTHTISIRDEEGSVIPGLQIARGYQWNGTSSGYQWSSREWETERYYNRATGVMTIEIDEPQNAKIAYRFRASGFRETVVELPGDGEPAKSFKVQPKAAETFHGRVVDASTGQPLAGVKVALVSTGDALRSDYYVDYTTPWGYIENKEFPGLHSVTDADGRFEMSRPMTQGVTEFVLMRKDGSFHHITNLDDLLTARTEEEEQIELPFPAPGTIEGQLSVAGKPLANERIHLQWQGHHEIDQSHTRLFGVGGQVTTDSTGRYQFPSLGPGHYRLSRVFRVELSQGSSTSMYLDGRDVVLLPGQSIIHDLKRPAGLSLAGVTVDESGDPIGHCIVSVTSGDDATRRIAAVRSDEQGRFQLEHLAAGEYQVTAEHYPAANHWSGHDYRGSKAIKVTDNVEGVVVPMARLNNRQPVTTPVLTGTLAPSFTATPHGHDEPFSLSDAFGKVVVVCFLASWSTDAAALNAVYEQFEDDDNVEFLGVFLEKDTVFAEFQKTASLKFPVVTTDRLETGSMSQLFGAAGGQTCYVIGRDGLFARERLIASQLADGIEYALSRPLDVSTSNDIAQVKVTLAADGGENGVLGAKLTFKAIGENGKKLKEARFGLNATVRDVVWHYPALSQGGKIQVTVSAPGIPDQTKSIDQPDAESQLEFSIASPRRITGRVLTVNDQQPVAGTEIILGTQSGGILTAATGAEGRFSVPCFPQLYYVSVRSNERFAMTQSSPVTVNVSPDADPEPINLQAVPAITIKGRVLDQSGESVSGAVISSPTGEQIVTDDDGGFTLTGIASVGNLQLWAQARGVWGAIRLSDPSANEIHTITLGQGLDTPEDSNATGLTIGDPIPELQVETLEGEPFRWPSTSDTNRLLVLTRLWHPTSADFVGQAQRWAGENDASVELISLDWSIEQARRELKRLDFDGRAFFGGPGKLKLSDDWKFNGTGAAFHVSEQGLILGTPLRE